ncbi:MAG: NAD(P)H-dependent oxidoreductase [bacterium]|nr:NAD(P)H-dependent oxidoreductase [bacterium]
MKDVIEALNWRYSTNVFDQNKRLSTEDLDYLLEAMRLSPSSFGVQPWKFIVVTNPEIRAKIREAGYGQPKISEASHLIVFAIPKDINETVIDNFVKAVAKARGVEVDAVKGLRDMVTGSMAQKTEEGRRAWATNQVYIALGVLLTAVAVRGIDAGPMEGFDPKKVDEILGLAPLGLESRVMAAVGYRSESDPNANSKRMRFPKEEVVIEIK